MNFLWSETVMVAESLPRVMTTVYLNLKQISWFHEYKCILAVMVQNTATLRPEQVMSLLRLLCLHPSYYSAIPIPFPMRKSQDKRDMAL